jgi:hypothetical protein
MRARVFGSSVADSWLCTFKRAFTFCPSTTAPLATQIFSRSSAQAKPRYSWKAICDLKSS